MARHVGGFKHVNSLLLESLREHVCQYRVHSIQLKQTLGHLQLDTFPALLRHGSKADIARSDVKYQLVEELIVLDLNSSHMSSMIELLWSLLLVHLLPTFHSTLEPLDE